MDPLCDSRVSRSSEKCWGGAERALPWTLAGPQVAAPDQLFMGQMEKGAEDRDESNRALPDPH